MIHLLLKFGSLGLYFLDASEQSRTEVGEDIGRADGAEHVGYGIAYRHDFNPGFLVGGRDVERVECVGTYSDYGRHSLRAGEKTEGFAGVVVHQESHNPCGEEAQHAQHAGKQHLLNAIALERVKKLWADAVADSEEEEEKESVFDRARNRDVKLSDEHPDKEHRGDIAQRERLVFQLAYKKAESQREKDGEGRIVLE